MERSPTNETDSQALQAVKHLYSYDWHFNIVGMVVIMDIALQHNHSLIIFPTEPLSNKGWSLEKENPTQNPFNKHKVDVIDLVPELITFLIP